MLSLWDALGVPPTRVPINASTLASYILPPIACNFAMAVLVLMPQTHGARLALWPVFVLLALRAVTSVDMSFGNPELKIVSGFLAVTMFNFLIRTLDWALEREPLVRHLRPANSAPSIIMDALDLCTNTRGYGWNWSQGLQVPRETRPMSRIPFVSYTLLSAVVHAFAGGVSYLAILLLVGPGSITKGLTALETLPFFARHFQASIFTVLTGIMSYALMQMTYDLNTIVGVLFLRQDPAQWPPAFDAPWRATSLIDFWGRRWHQWCRRLFLFLGGYPLSIFFGRAGIILGAFLASALMHDIMLVGVDHTLDAWGMLLSFGMMAPGMLAERAFYRWTGKKVGGAVGWVWTMAWLLLWFRQMFDGFARAGITGGLDNLGGVPALAQRLVERG